MDVDLMRSSPSSNEEQMDMVSMMMNIEKLPHFFDPNNNSTSSTTLNEIQFPSNALASVTSPMFPNPQATTSPTYNLNHPTHNSIPFMGTPIQEPITPPPLQTSSTTKFRFPPPFLSNQTSYLSSIEKKNSTAAIREMIFRIAAMQPVHIDPEAIKPPKRRNVKISKDPQSVAARHRRERISERIRILQRLVPGGTKMDTASMLDEAIHYVKFLKNQVQSLEQAGANNKGPIMGTPGFGLSSSGVTINPCMGYFSLGKNCQPTSMCMQVGICLDN